MFVQINTDNQISGSAEMNDRLEREITGALGRFADRITRLEVHVGDENQGAASGDDIRCSIEARLANRPPETVIHNAGSPQQAASGAAKKLRRVLERTIGKLDDRHGKDSIRTGDFQ